MASGFQYVDFNNVDITTTRKQVKGVYKTIKGNYRRALILHNCSVNGSNIANCTTFAKLVSNNFVLYYGDTAYHISVTENDMVSIISES